MEVLVSKTTTVLYIGLNQRFAEEFHRFSQNVTVNTVDSTEDAIKWLHNHSNYDSDKWINAQKAVDAILCEKTIPTKNIKEFQRYLIKVFDPAKKIPLVILANKVTKKEKLKTLENGFDDIFSHPIKGVD